jgi:hypothetical protein
MCLEPIRCELRLASWYPKDLMLKHRSGQSLHFISDLPTTSRESSGYFCRISARPGGQPGTGVWKPLAMIFEVGILAQ